ncbi:UNVERIFIED_CONTAM: radical SAM methylthiotransferase, MiaB/RimO family protein [Hammondia hammondi]|eukprot:XP_008882626.1 radical SAM methylthiotransferase, MiaB/RimO family protein [Hammondia hammondi]
MSESPASSLTPYGGEGVAVVGGASLVCSSAAALSSRGPWRSSALLPALALTGVGCAVGFLLYSAGVSSRLKGALSSDAGAARAATSRGDDQRPSACEEKKEEPVEGPHAAGEDGDEGASGCSSDRCRCDETGKETKETAGCQGGDSGCGSAACCQNVDGETRQTELELAGEDASECDLEDLQPSDEEGVETLEPPAHSHPTFPRVKPKRQLRRKGTESGETKSQGEEEDRSEETGHGEDRRDVGAAGESDERGRDFFQPGRRQRIFVKTFGCAHNQSDSEYMMGLLDAAGYAFVSRMEDADVCLINSCTVKSPSEFALYSVIQDALQVEVPSASVVRAQQRAKAAKKDSGSQQCALPSSSCSSSSCCSSDSTKPKLGGEDRDTERREREQGEGEENSACLGCGGADACPPPFSLTGRAEEKEEKGTEEAGAGEAGRSKSSTPVARQPIPCVVAGCVPYGLGGDTRDDHSRGRKRGDSAKQEAKHAPEGAGEKKQSGQRDLLKLCSTVGVSAIDRIVEAVEEALKGNVIRLGGKRRLPSLDLPKIRRNALVEIVPISTGCLGSCTYCKTKHARGDLGSYPEEAIEKRVEASLEEGVKQIWLTSEDSGAYGLDRQSSLTGLLARLLRNVFDRKANPSLMLRVGMSNPPFLLQQLKSAVQVFGHPNVFEFLHLPLQSGSNDVLLAMNREYTAEQFEVVVETLLKHFPRMTIATDIICGFPGETDEDHERTLAIIRKFKFPVVNISQFYPRPGTPAASMKQLPSQVVKRRSREVTALFESYTCYDWMLHTTQMVWFSSTSEKSDHTVGQTKQYVKVLTPRDDALLGTCCLMYVTAVEKWHVVAVRAEPEGKKATPEI